MGYGRHEKGDSSTPTQHTTLPSPSLAALSKRNFRSFHSFEIPLMADSSGSFPFPLIVHMEILWLPNKDSPTLVRIYEKRTSSHIIHIQTISFSLIKILRCCFSSSNFCMFPKNFSYYSPDGKKLIPTASYQFPVG